MTEKPDFTSFDSFVLRTPADQSVKTAQPGSPGLFKGFAMGCWGAQNKIPLPGPENYIWYVYPDMNYLYALTQALANHPTIKKQIKYFPNSTSYITGEQLHYVKYYPKNGQLIQELMAIDHSDYLQAVLDKAAGGAHLTELVNVLVSEDISAGEAGDFIEELRELQVLTNEIAPPPADPNSLQHLAAILEPIKNIDDIKQTLGRIQSALQEINETRAGDVDTVTSLYDTLCSSLSTSLREIEAIEAVAITPTGDSLEFRHRCHPLVIIPTEDCTLNKKISDEVLKGIEVLSKLSTPVMQGSTPLELFKKRFFSAYGQREVPLLQVLEPQTGIGYKDAGKTNEPPGTLEVLLTPRFSGTYDIHWDRLHALLSRKFVGALTGRNYEIILTDDDLNGFESQWGALPNCISATIQIPTTKEHKGKQQKILLGPITGPAASHFPGYFSHSHDGARSLIKEIALKEEEMNPGAVHAAFIHLPEPGTNDIAFPTGTYRYEIPYLAGPTAPDEFQIKLDDLMISVRDHRVVLRSRRLNKEVIPRLNSASYDYNEGGEAAASPVYRFFSDLQSQSETDGNTHAHTRLEFSWGALDSGYKFLPRVCYENIIISLAKWHFNEKDIKHFSKIPGAGDDDQLLQAIDAWRREFQIPAKVFLDTGDNKKMYLDLENLFFIKALLSAVKDKLSFRLTEFLFDPGNALVESESPEGAFCHEFMLFYYNRAAVNHAAHRADAEVVKRISLSPAFKKDKLGFEKRETNFCLVMPDHFGSFIRTMGLHIVGNEIAEKTPYRVDFACLPDVEDDENETTEEKLLTLFSNRPVNEADIIGLSIPNPMALLNVFRFFSLTGIPPYRKDRTTEHPLVIAGNSGVLNPAPFENFIDAFVIGDGEGPAVEIANAYHMHKGKGKNRSELLEILAKIPGVYVPGFTERKYNEQGQLIDVIYRGNPEGLVRYSHVPDINNTRRASLLISPFSPTLILIDYSCQYKCAFCQMSNTRGAYRWINAGEIKKYLAEFDEMRVESVGVAGTCVAKQDNLGDVFSWASQLKNVNPYIYGSLRVDDIRNVKEILPEIVYIAPETGNDYLRNKILLKTSKLKSIKEDIEYILKETKVYRLVLCNIVGIPTETGNDYEESIELIIWAGQQMGKMRDRGEISVSIDPLLPQPGTPYEERGMIGPDTFEKIVENFSGRIEVALPGNVDFSIRHINALDHLVEGIVNTGDQWTGDFFFTLYNNKTGWNIPDIIKAYNEKIDVNDTSDYLHRANWQVKPWKMIEFGNAQYLEKAKAEIRKNINDRKG